MPIINTKPYKIDKPVIKSKVLDVFGFKVTVYAKNGFLVTAADFVNAMKKSAADETK